MDLRLTRSCLSILVLQPTHLVTLDRSPLGLSFLIFKMAGIAAPPQMIIARIRCMFGQQTLSFTPLESAIATSVARFLSGAEHISVLKPSRSEPAGRELHVQGEAAVSEFLLGLQEARSRGSGCLAEHVSEFWAM